MTLEHEMVLYKNAIFIKDHITRRNKILEDTMAFMGLLRFNIDFRKNEVK